MEVEFAGKIRDEPRINMTTVETLFVRHVNSGLVPNFLFLSVVVNHDAATTVIAAKVRGGTGVLVCTELVVVDCLPGVLVPNFDAECVGSGCLEVVTINGCNQESIVSGPVNRPAALELRLSGAIDDEPLIHGALELEFRNVELKFGLTGRNACSL